MKPRRSFRDYLWWVLRIANLSLLFMIAAVTGLLLGTYSAVSKVIPKARDLGDIQPGRGCRVLSAEGELLATVATENREFATLESMPQELQNAVIAIEDRDFYRHIGVHPKAIVRAAVHDLLALGPRQGGSTITQQLARSVYLTRSKTLARKLAELILALQLERAYTKPEILELYLNQVYFGEGAYGVQVAAKTYFGKQLSQLNLPECALLAGLPKAPERYSPFEDEQRAVDRRNLVLAKMREEGYISEYQWQEAREAPLRLVKDRKPLGINTYRAAPYFVSYVLRDLAARYGPDALYKGGLTIQTTLNLEMQRAAEEAVKWGMAYYGRSYKIGKMALVAVEVHTGAIKAMVGGPDWKKSQYNSAVQGGRPAGSSFKPFVYTAALEQGYTPESKVMNTPVSYPGAGGKRWRPRNYSPGGYGPVTFRRALALSINIPAVKVADMVGIGSVIATAERMGIYHSMEPVLPLAIGYCSVSPLEMASAFGVFANRGMRTEPYGIRKVVDSRGRTVYEHQVKTWRVLDERIAATMVDMLSDVIKYGTAARIKRQLTFPAAGKTGTSSDHRDAWFVGFTSDLSAAVWAGNDDYSPTRRLAGSIAPAPVWARFMVQAQPVMADALAKEREPVIEISSEDQGSPEPPKKKPSAEPKQDSADISSAPVDTDRFVTEEICPVSGLLHGPTCPAPVQVTYDLESGDRPPDRACDVHGEAESGEQAAEQPERPERPAPPPPPKRARPAPHMVTLPICAITGKLATAFCPVVRNQTFLASEAPTETCTRHGRRAPGP